MMRCKECIYFSHEGENGYGQCDLSYKERHRDKLCEGLECKRKPKEKVIPMKEIDWEQRRYEIAKQMMLFCAPKWWHNINQMKADKCAQAAVKYADALINELKKTSK